MKRFFTTIRKYSSQNDTIRQKLKELSTSDPNLLIFLWFRCHDPSSYMLRDVKKQLIEKEWLNQDGSLPQHIKDEVVASVKVQNGGQISVEESSIEQPHFHELGGP